MFVIVQFFYLRNRYYIITVCRHYEKQFELIEPSLAKKFFLHQ